MLQLQHALVREAACPVELPQERSEIADGSVAASLHTFDDGVELGLTHAIQVEVVEKPREEVVELCEKFFGPGLGSEQERNPALDEIVELGEHFADRHIGGESPGVLLVVTEQRECTLRLSCSCVGVIHAKGDFGGARVLRFLGENQLDRSWSQLRIDVARRFNREGEMFAVLNRWKPARGERC